VFAETLDNYQYSTHLTPESQSFTLNASRWNLRSRVLLLFFNRSL
jgi:hypothetical protein